VNLIGEHTDYNGGLALPFAIAEGVTVRAWVGASSSSVAGPRIRAHALNLGEYDEFAPADQERRQGWRAFVRGMAAELYLAGVAVPDGNVEIGGDLPRGVGLSSSAALEVSLALALLGLAGAPAMDGRELARLCSRVESKWIGAHTGLLDQLASLFGEPDAALCIDFSNLEILPVPLVLDSGWRMVVLDSGEPRELSRTGYNERRAECARACELLGIDSLRALEQATRSQLEAISDLPDVLARRVTHVLGENARVVATVAALRGGDLNRVGELLDESHASLREQYECSTPAVEATVGKLKRAGAVGARMVGGGFGGSVLGLLAPDAHAPPPGTHAVHPSPGARILV
jgi:galactokinase